MTFTPLGEIINQRSWRGPTREIILSLRIEKLLTKLLRDLPPQTEEKVRMRSFREGSLNLLVPTPTISQEIHLHSKVIIERLNTALGERAVKRISFKTDTKEEETTPEAAPA